MGDGDESGNALRTRKRTVCLPEKGIFRGLTFASLANHLRNLWCYELFLVGQVKAPTLRQNIIRSYSPRQHLFRWNRFRTLLDYVVLRITTEGKPFFTITQNQLADGTYLEYVRKLCGKKIYVASEADSQKAFEAYLADAQNQLQTGKLKPGGCAHH